MPYFIFKYLKEDDEITSIEYVGSQDQFKPAKNQTREIRSQLPTDSDHLVKMVFSDTREQATALLQEKRSAPILKEWEK